MDGCAAYLIRRYVEDEVKEKKKLLSRATDAEARAEKVEEGLKAVEDAIRKIEEAQSRREAMERPRPMPSELKSDLCFVLSSSLNKGDGLGKIRNRIMRILTDWFDRYGQWW